MGESCTNVIRVRRWAWLAVLASILVVIAGCATGRSDTTATQAPTPTPTPLGFGIPTPFGSDEPYEKRPESVFPVHFIVPDGDAGIWTTVRRVGDPSRDATLTLVVEGYVEAPNGFNFDYGVSITDDKGVVYRLSPRIGLGALAAGAKRKFEAKAQLPAGARISAMDWMPTDGHISGEILYHLDIAVAAIWEYQFLPSGYEEAQ